DAAGTSRSSSSDGSYRSGPRAASPASSPSRALERRTFEPGSSEAPLPLLLLLVGSHDGEGKGRALLGFSVRNEHVAHDRAADVDDLISGFLGLLFGQGPETIAERRSLLALLWLLRHATLPSCESRSPAPA